MGGSRAPSDSSDAAEECTLQQHSDEENDLGVSGPDLSVPWPEDSPNPIAEVDAWVRGRWQRFRHDHAGYTRWDWLKTFVPFVRVCEKYDLRRQLIGDVVAGLTVGAMMVPQGLSYAKLAGLPSVFGLYGGFLPVIVYGLLGTSRQLGVGPVAVTSLLLGSGLPSVINAAVQVDPNNPSDPFAQAEYNQAAIQVAFLAGLMYTAAGLLGLGWVMNFLSHAVISGFMTGASLVIGLSQAKYLFGYNTRPGPNPGDSMIGFPRVDPIHLQISALLSPDWLPYFHWREFVMGSCWIAFIIGMRRLGLYHVAARYCSYFSALVVVILSTVLVGHYHWNDPPVSIQVVGVIPAGLPGPTVGLFFPMTNAGPKFLLAALVCLVDMLESISIARALALRHNYALDATTEIRALGVANIFGACFSCYTTTGSFCRSSVLSSAGANTQAAGIVTAVVVMIVLLVATPLFTNLPMNAMAAIVIAAMPPLFNYTEFLFLWKVNKQDCLVFTVAFLGTTFLGVDLGLAIAIGVSILLVVLKSAFPHITVLGHLPGTTIYRSVTMSPDARELDDFLILRIDAPIFFANINPIGTHITHLQRQAAAEGRRCRFLVLDLAAVPHIDGPAVHFLRVLIQEQAKKGVQLVLAHPTKAVLDILVRSGLDDLIGRQFIGMDLHATLERCLKARDVESPIP